MKPVQLITILVGILMASSSLFAQDDFYKEKENKKVVAKTSQSDTLGISIFDEDNYMSEEDYYETYYDKEYSNDEVYMSKNEREAEEEHRKARNRRITGEIVGEIIYHVVFSIAVILTW